MSQTPAEGGAPRPSQPRLVDVFLQYLKAEGVRYVFGIPGGLLYPFFDAVEGAAEKDAQLRHLPADAIEYVVGPPPQVSPRGHAG